MILSNYHSHSTFCDGRSSMEEFVKFAIAKGVKRYGFSSHAPIPFDTPWTMVADDFPEYEAEFFRLKEKYIESIELYLGLEVDYIHGCSDIKSDFFRNINLDYSIGSIHYLDCLGENNYWSIDGPFDEFEKGLNTLYNGDIEAGTKRFFEISGLMIEKGGFDVVGHVDKITYHGRKYSAFDINKPEYQKLMLRLLEQIKAQKLILEVNTKSLADHGITYPHQAFYETIARMEIPLMLNSDCHYPTNITAGFDITCKALSKAGIKYLIQLTEDGWKKESF